MQKKDHAIQSVRSLTRQILQPALLICGSYYFIFYACVFFKNAFESKEVLSLFEFSTVSVEIALEVMFIFLSYLVMKNIDKQDKKPFYFLTGSFVFLLLTGILYVLIFDYYKIKPSDNPESSLCFISFSAYLILQIVFWCLLLKNKVTKKIKSWNFIALGFLGLIFLVVFLIDSTSHIYFEYLSYEKIYNVFTGLLNITLFYIAAIGLVCATNKGLYWLALSSMILVGANLWVNYLFQVGLLVSTFDYSDAFWSTGLIVGNFGLIRLLIDEKTAVTEWFYSLNRIKCQVSMTTFIFTMTTLLILVLLAAYAGVIEKKSIVSLPFAMMLYSLIVLLISDKLGSKLENIFEEMRRNIKNYIENNKGKKIYTSFKTEEFLSLQKFIFKMIDAQDEQNKQKKALSDLAAQVAHDIRSPVSAVLLFSKNYTGLPETQRMLLRNSANRIQNIANNLLNHYGDDSVQLNTSTISVAEAVSSVFIGKKFEYQALPINFLSNIQNNALFLFISICKSGFERMISNIINNSVEAINKSGEIKISVYRRNDHLIISVTDNGSGISQENIKKILSGSNITSKKMGHGLGLTYTKNLLKKHNANFNIESTLNIGTTIELQFPVVPCPIWIAKSITLKPDSIIIVLDDDASIHRVWDERLSAFLTQHVNMQLHHFNNAEQCLEAIKKYYESGVDKKIVLLTDYELINQDINGLDVIEISRIKNSVLVTSHFENLSIIKQSILLNKKILPKTLSPDVDIEVFAEKQESELEVPDLLLVENSQELSDILSYLYANKNKKLIAYANPYEFLSVLPKIRKDIKICFDYDLALPVNGLELAIAAENEGFHNLYLATGYDLDKKNLPQSITLLKNKMELLKL